MGFKPKHDSASDMPTVRKVRRACKKELYRTIKRLPQHITPDLAQQAEKMYFQKVAAHFLWITENRSNRKALCDWWDQEVCPEIAQLWGVPPEQLARAFRDAFGG